MILPSLAGAGPYEVLLLDCPWHYTGATDKDQAAGKHYDLLTLAELKHLPVRGLLAKRAIVYLWATCPKLHHAVELGLSWGLRFVGVPFVWVKTSRKGRIIHGQGVRPTIVKPTVEQVLAFTNVTRGRPLPVLNEGVAQVATEPRPANQHSAKPEEIQRRIETLHGPQRRLELFARTERQGWDAWGAGVGSAPFVPPAVDAPATS